MAYGSASAAKWLVGLLSFSFVLGLLSVLCTLYGLVSAKAQGQGVCTNQTRKEYAGLGKWDDGPSDLHLNWYVCEIEHRDNVTYDGWHRFGRNWYKAFCGWHRWEVAEFQCRVHGFDMGHLATITSKEENEWVATLCGYEACWIGLHELEHTEEWVWNKNGANNSVGHKGVWKGYTNWNDGEPNNGNRVDESVAYMNAWYRLDMPDASVDAGACEGPPRVAPTGSGKWFDLSEDFRVEYSVCERHRPNGTDCEPSTPSAADVIAGTYWQPFQNSCYMKHCGTLDFWEASAMCKNHDADLVSISSPAENQFVRRICGLNTCRIGLLRDSDSEGWHWTDGTNIGEKYEWTGYVNWNDGEQGDASSWGGSEDTAVMNSNDVVVSIRKGFLFAKMKPMFVLWAILELGGPLLLLCAACLAGRYQSACVASCLRTSTGMASCWLGCFMAIALCVLRAVNDMWPGGSRELLVFLAFVAFLETVTCCMASARAQELQWSTTMPFSAMGVRNVGDGDSGVALSSNMRSSP